MTPAYRALDYVFRVDADEPLGSAVAAALTALAVAIRPTAVPTVVATRDPDGTWSLGDDDPQPLPVSVLGRGLGLGAALARLLEHVNQRAAASLTAEVPLHAATVTTEDGRGVALAGRSGSGKSTLGLAAAFAGWGLLAEELSAVDPDSLAVRPYPRPVGVRRGGAAALGLDYPDDPDGRYEQVWPRPVEPEHLADRGRLSTIVLVDRVAGSAPSTEPLRPARALAELAEHCVVPDDRRLVTHFRALERIVRTVPVMRLTYDRVGDGVARLHELAT